MECACGAGGYDECCGPIHAGGAGLGTTAEQLMRARYSAYANKDETFLLESWHPRTRPPSISFDPTVTWLGLTVLDVVGGGGLDGEGEVEFIARFRRGDTHHELHERSSFVRLSGRWVYLDGESR